MFAKACIFFTLWAGVAALTLQADDPVDFSRESSDAPVEFTKEYRMNLVRQMQAYTFDDFVADYDKPYKKDTPEYKKRAAIFYRRKAETIRLAGLPKLTWTPALNGLLDQTKPEIKARLGYRPEKGKKAKGLSFARQPLETVPKDFVAAVTLDWRPNMTYSVDFQKDQGACGSCWAVAAATSLEQNTDIIFKASVPLSAQQLVSCTPNPRHCGGQGGCEGATAELAYDYLAQAGGIVGEEQYKYTSMYGDSGICDTAKTKEFTVTVSGYKGIPVNNYHATMYALQQGTLVVAVDASPWSFYGGGIFNSCKRDATLNHAVVLVGYGTDGARGYWLIRNSWGSDWGINGYIKLSRASTTANFANAGHGKPKAGFCGMDYNPQEGSACDGETDPVEVCGMCGILYEPVLPIVTKFTKPANFDAIIEGIKSRRFAEIRSSEKRLARKIR